MFWWHKAFVHSTNPNYVEFFRSQVLPRMTEASSGALPSAREPFNPRAHLPAPSSTHAPRPTPPLRRL